MEINPEKINKTYESLESYNFLPRVKSLLLSADMLHQFLFRIKSVDVEILERRPYMRFFIAEVLSSLIGEELVFSLYRTLLDRASGALVVSLDPSFKDLSLETLLKIATALSHLLGSANFDGMTDKYYALFEVNHIGVGDSILRFPYYDLRLHTDGTFLQEKTDWILMGKTYENCVEGGRSRFLHIDDWGDFHSFYKNPFGTEVFRFKSTPSKKAFEEVYKPIFQCVNNHTIINFSDQFAYPRNRQEALYLHALSESLEADKNVMNISLKVGSFILLNNHVWVHGREKFVENPNLRRGLLRQRGVFSEEQGL